MAQQQCALDAARSQQTLGREMYLKVKARFILEGDIIFLRVTRVLARHLKPGATGKPYLTLGRIRYSLPPAPPAAR